MSEIMEYPLYKETLYVRIADPFVWRHKAPSTATARGEISYATLSCLVIDVGKFDNWFMVSMAQNEC